MKKSKSVYLEWQLDDVAPPLTGRDLLHLDGQLFEGERGTLGVALRPESLARVYRQGVATHWVLPIEKPKMVKEAAELPGQIFWVSTRPPGEIVGALNEDFQGAWIEGSAMVVSMGDTRKRLHMARPPHAAFANEYLARAIVNQWTGVISDYVLQSASLSRCASESQKQLAA